MDRSEYIEYILDHFQHPRNKGRMEGADVQLGGGNPGCGDLITMYLKLDEDDRIAAVSFEGEGCTISQAGASMVAEKYEGQSLEEIEASNVDDMIDEMGREVVMSRIRCASVGIGTLKAAVQQLRRDAVALDLEAGARPTS